MTQTLATTLLGDAKRPAVAADLSALVDAEVGAKGGISGTVIKGGYAAVKKAKPGFVQHALDQLLPGFVAALEPFWAEHRAAGGNDFGAFLVERKDASADALLTVTDARAKASNKGAVKKVYEKLRPKAKENVIEALPRLGAVIDKHTS